MSEQGWTLHLHRMTAERARTLLAAQGFSVRCRRPAPPGPAELRALEALGDTALVPADFRDDLVRYLSMPEREAGDWVRDHGVERLLGLPCVKAFGHGSTFDDVRAMVPGAVEIVPAPKGQSGPSMLN